MTDPSTEIVESTIVTAVAHNSSCNLSDEAVVLNLDSGIYYGLNPVGNRVWSLLKEEQTVAALRDAIVDEYEVEEQRCLEDVIQLLRELKEAGLVSVRNDAQP